MLQDIGMSTTQVGQLNEYLLKSDLIELKKDLNDTQGIDELQNLMDMMETAGFSDYLNLIFPLSGVYLITRCSL
ncbi:MAG: hypothetical protein Ct9H300mP21_05370 [Pseudomonadota bacterium]|nr:MAG: hypothetical protein Ct9H300mP21_05370 [Pseudomonadota bacterium]